MTERNMESGYRYIPTSRPNLRPKDRDRLLEVFDRGMIAYGAETRKFEEDVSRYLGLADGVATNQGMSAAHIALEALGIGAGDEVIVPSYVCSSVHRAIELSGARPILADVEENGYNMDPKSVEGNLNDKTKAIFLPHMFGTPGDIERLLDLAEDHSVYLLEDCAQSLGGELYGKKLGSFGDAAVCSFKATKVLASGEGGMALFKSREFADKCRDLVTTDKRPCGYGRFYGYLIPDLNAALGRSQFEDIDFFVRKRKDIAKIYDDTFESLGVEAMKVTNRNDSIFFRYVINVEDPEFIMSEMKKFNVHCGKPVNTPAHQDEKFKIMYKVSPDNFPNTDWAYRSILFIPLYPSMDKDMIEQVCSSVEKVWKK